jgi:hypothetical protein
MKKVVLKLKGLTVSSKITFGRLVASSINGNDDYPNPSPTVAQTNTATNELETAYNEAESARMTAKEKTAILKRKEAEFDKVMNKVGNYVENESGGDETKILGAGLQVKAKGVRHKDVLPKPENLSAKNTDNHGEIILRWGKVAGSKNYNIEICLDPEEENVWKHIEFSTKLKLTISGLVSGQRYWFRVSAINSRGESPFSEPVSRIVQ